MGQPCGLRSWRCALSCTTERIGVSVMGYTVVVPTKHSENLSTCLADLARAQKQASVIVVDDSTDESILDTYLQSGCNGMVLAGLKPFIFARNINHGIAMAGSDD